MQNPTSAVSELEIHDTTPITFMTRLKTVLDRLGWQLVDTEFETIEILVPRANSNTQGELYLELDEEHVNIRYHIPASFGEDVTEELEETVLLFKEEYNDVIISEEDEAFLKANFAE
jgi:hypothetical protein